MNSTKFSLVPGHNRRIVSLVITFIYFATIVAGYSILGLYPVLVIMHSFKFTKT